MTSCVRDPKSKCLNRLKNNLDNSSESEAKSEKKKMAKA